MDHTAFSPRRLARISIDYEAIAENWRWFARRAGAAECAAVVKADAYGLGAAEAARALYAAGAHTFFTATLGEAERVRPHIGEAVLYVFNGPRADDAAHFAACDARPVLNSLAQIALWRGRGSAALHIDTGMNRLGLPLTDLAEAATLSPDMTLVMSHLACASTRKHEMNARQRALFVEAASAFPRARRSLAATSGALLGHEYAFDMIRPGIGLYGSGAMDEGNPILSPAARIEAPIVQIRDVAAGESFGYGATQRAQAPMRAAIVALGYADGFLRGAAGRGYGVLGGVQLPLLGRVSMDLLILDASAAPEAAVGDYVEFLGHAARLDDVAAAFGTAPYEVLTTFAGAVRRGS